MPLPIVVQGIGDSWRKTNSAFVAIQTTSWKDCEHYERPEMMFVSLSAQGAYFFRYFALGALAHSFTICAGDEITISGRPLYHSILPVTVNGIASQGLKELLSSYGGNVLRRDEACENLLWVFRSEVEESIAPLGKANLFNKAAHAGVLSDRCSTAASHAYEKDGE
jgi:hypothetical protein